MTNLDDDSFDGQEGGKIVMDASVGTVVFGILYGKSREIFGWRRLIGSKCRRQPWRGRLWVERSAAVVEPDRPPSSPGTIGRIQTLPIRSRDNPREAAAKWLTGPGLRDQAPKQSGWEPVFRMSAPGYLSSVFFRPLPSFDLSSAGHPTIHFLMARQHRTMKLPIVFTEIRTVM